MNRRGYSLILLLLVAAGLAGFTLGRSTAPKEPPTVRIDTRVRIQTGGDPKAIDGWIPPGLYTEQITWRFTGLTRSSSKTGVEEAHYVYTLALKNVYDNGDSRGYTVRMHFVFMDEAQLVLFESPVEVFQYPISEANYVEDFDGSGWLPLGLTNLVKKVGWRGEMQALPR